MENFIKKSLAILVLFCLASCATKQQTGAGLGVAAGGLVGAMLGHRSGNTFAGVALGSVLGGIAGSAIGHQLDKNDKKLMEQATANALESTKSGNKVKWHNPDSGHEGYVTPVKTYESGNRYCREFIQQASVGGKNVTVYGKACRQPDGQWQIISSDE